MLTLKDKIICNSKVNEENNCWEWQRGRAGNGYGVICVGHQKNKYAHRVSYEVFKTGIPKGLVIRHSCDNPCCVNPAHLSTGTHKQNTGDAIRRGRMIKPPIHLGESNPKAKLTEDQVIEIRNLTGSNIMISKIYNVSAVMVGLIKRGKAWKHLG